MVECVFRINFAGPLVTVQDGGRFGHMRFGVSASGPMDRLAAAAANAVLGNTHGAPLIEVSMGGLALECISGEITLAVAGGEFLVERSDGKLACWSVFKVEAGDKLTIRPAGLGSWTYLAFAGHLQAQEWLGSVATHSISGFGGGQLASGQELRLSDAHVAEDRHGTFARPDFAAHSDTIRVVLGPQDRYFTAETREIFKTASYRLSSAFDRMGVRLVGPDLPLNGALSIPSEPVARGSIQVSGDGVPTVLLADHQTTGGYPKIATVVSVDLDRLCQSRAGDTLRFTPVSPAEAVALVRAVVQKRQAYLEEIAIPKGTLAQRLMRENLISGALDDDGQ
ncbi:biotin-dependent carboxyltransferase family protein [Shimia sp. SDUM112013]|uniref:5-oxoprolinase subunit C family protein n=1 Tax=Shimia sp. SDUM112013 TaxID=3136160 RepID=UPI0032EE70DD